MDGQASNVFVLKDNPPAVCLIHTGKQVDQRGLPGPVRSNNGNEFARLDIKTNVVNGGQTAKTLGKVLDL